MAGAPSCEYTADTCPADTFAVASLSACKACPYGATSSANSTSAQQCSCGSSFSGSIQGSHLSSVAVGTCVGDGVQWRLGDAGDNCNTVCNSASAVCDSTAFAKIGNFRSGSVANAKEYLQSLDLEHQCASYQTDGDASLAPYMDPREETSTSRYCYVDGTQSSQAVCSSLDSRYRRWCPCSCGAGFFNSADADAPCKA